MDQKTERRFLMQMMMWYFFNRITRSFSLTVDFNRNKSNKYILGEWQCGTKDKSEQLKLNID